MSPCIVRVLKVTNLTLYFLKVDNTSMTHGLLPVVHVSVLFIMNVTAT